MKILLRRGRRGGANPVEKILREGVRRRGLVEEGEGKRADGGGV